MLSGVYLERKMSISTIYASNILKLVHTHQKCFDFDTNYFQCSYKQCTLPLGLLLPISALPVKNVIFIHCLKCSNIFSTYTISICFIEDTFSMLCIFGKLLKLIDLNI